MKINANDNGSFTIDLGIAEFTLTADQAGEFAAKVIDLQANGKELPNPLNLNAKELDVLKAMEPSSDGNGHDFGFTDEVDFESVGFTKAQYAGYVSSLKAKGAFRYFEDLSKDPGIQCNSVQFQFSSEAFATLGLDDEIDAH